MDRVRLGVVGSGWAARTHLAVLRDEPDVVVTGIASRHLERAEALAHVAGPGVAAHADHRALIDAGDLDALVLCLPPDARGAPELDALDLGLHLLVEKPIGLDASLPDRIGARIRDTGVVVSVGYQWRYLDLTGQARELLGERPPQLLLGTWLGETPSAPWWVRQASSGGQVLEQATHILDLMRYLVGECRVVAGRAADAAPDARGDADIRDVSVTLLAFETGAIGSLATTRLLDRGHRAGLEAFSVGRSLALEISPHRLVVRERGRTTDIATTFDRLEPYRRQDRAFLDAILGRGDDIRSPWDDALRTHALALEATRAVLAPAP
ncbi:MAG: Gfo/Idh/MocA family oxidoreductase [Candidatus Limnocylindrales bacterium]